MFLHLNKYYLGDQAKTNEMAGSYSAYGKDEMCIQGFGGEI